MSEHNDRTPIEHFAELIEQSPLGTPGARELRQRACDDLVTKLMGEVKAARSTSQARVEGTPVRTLAPSTWTPINDRVAAAETKRHRKILAVVAEVIEDITDIDARTVRPEQSLTDDLHIDSLMMMEMKRLAEDAFGQAIPARDLLGLHTVADVIAYIDRLQTPTTFSAPTACSAIDAAGPFEPPSASTTSTLHRRH